MPPIRVSLLTKLTVLAMVAMAPLAIGCGGDADGDSAEAAPKAPAPKPNANPAGALERVQADVGVGAKGKSLEGAEKTVGGILSGSASAKALFEFKENAAFNLQVKPALQLYKATNGKGPKSHEEFMEKIVKANQIKLPELPPGQRYIYDPAKEMLMVERPTQ